MKLTGFSTRIFIYAGIWYFLLSIAPDKKILFGICVVGMVALFRLVRDIKETLFISAVLLFPLHVGKMYPIDLIPATSLGILNRTLGISADIIVTPLDLVIGSMAIHGMLQVRRVSLHTLFPDRTACVLAIYAIVDIAVAYLGSVMPSVSLLHALFSIRPYVVYWYLQTIPSAHKNTQIYVWAMAAMYLFVSLFMLYTTVRRAPLGSILEPDPTYIPVDTSRDVADALVYRFGGVFPHANDLAHFLLFGVFMIFPLLFVRSQQKLGGIVLSFMLGAFIFSYSRSAWGAFFVCSVILWKWLSVHRVRLPWNTTIFRKSIWKRVAYSVGVLLFVPVVMRLIGTQYSFDKYGSIETRLSLFKESLGIIQQFPIYGVGMGMDVYYTYINSLWQRTQSVTWYFPEPVHNGFLRLFVQSGIIGIVAYAFAFYSILISTGRVFRKKDIFYTSVMAGIIAVCINACMQPLLPDLLGIVVFSMVYRYRPYERT